MIMNDEHNISVDLLIFLCAAYYNMKEKYLLNLYRDIYKCLFSTYFQFYLKIVLTKQIAISLQYFSSKNKVIAQFNNESEIQLFLNDMIQH